MIKIKSTITIHFVFTGLLLGQMGISGYATFVDNESGETYPLVGVKIELETLTPTVVMDPVYTDENGFYSFSFLSYPEMVGARLYFSNKYIRIEGYDGPRNDYYHEYPVYPDNDNVTLPSDYSIPWVTANFIYTGGNYNEYANVFNWANDATQIVLTNGFNPSQVTIRYPAETSIISDINLTIGSSFFWPYESISNLDEAMGIFLGIFISTVIPWLQFVAGHDFQLTENTIYLKSGYSKTTIYHEYGHFLHRYLRGGTWPVSIEEYLSGDEVPLHSFNQYNQTLKQAFLEGFADFFGSLVQSYYENPDHPYSGNYRGYNSLFEFTHNINSNYFSFNEVENGLPNEVTIGSSFFDLYDPIFDGDMDYMQMPLSEIFSFLENGDDTGLEYFTRVGESLYPLSIAPLFYVLDLNKIQQEIDGYTNFNKLKMKNKFGSLNLGGNLSFFDSMNNISVTVNSLGYQELPVLAGNKYSIETHLRDHPVYNHLNWGRLEYFKLKEENYEIEEQPGGMIAFFDEQQFIYIVSEIPNSFIIKDPWFIQDDGTQTGTDWVDIEGGSYLVFLDQGGSDTSNLIPPFYTVRAPRIIATQVSIYVLSGWNTTNATVAEDSNHSGDLSYRAVVFHSQGATVEAVYTAVNGIPNYTLTIEDDDSLTIPAGAIIDFATGFTIDVGGELIINGNPGQPVTLFCSDGGQWGGIRSSKIFNASDITINNTHIIDAVSAVDITYLSTPLRITESSFVNVGTGIKIDKIISGGDAEFTSLDIKADYAGIHLIGPIPHENHLVRVKRSLIEGSGLGYGILYEDIDNWNEDSANRIQLQNVTITHFEQGLELIYTDGNPNHHFKDVQVKNSIFWNNTIDITSADEANCAVSFSNVQNINPVNGIFNENPLFVDPENSDFTLQASSPCIDAGNPNSPNDPDGTIADIGAFPFLHYSGEVTGELADGSVLMQNVTMVGDVWLPENASLIIAANTNISFGS